MNRHHPYGGSYDGPRRGGGPSGNFGPGPDRSHNFERGSAPRGRGFGRGRGRGGGQHGGGHWGGYGNAGPYDQGPPQGDMGGYNNYDSGPPQGQYYQNGNNYNAPGPEQYHSDPSGGYDMGHGYEDGSGQNYNQGGGGYNNRFQQRRPQRRERDNKVHDSIIEERIQRERPCRTLFIRNIKYETSSEDVRRLFEEHGDIKTFFDLIANRGMVFVTFYDLRAAERARDRLQGSEISGRPIDVHYSLPRDDQRGADRQKDQELQGHLIVTLRNSPTNQPLDENEVRRKFQQFGEVKSVRPCGDRPDQRYVEFFDTRACEQAHDRLRHQGLQDGVMEIVYASPSDDPRSAEAQGQQGGGGGGGGGGGVNGGFERPQREWDEGGHNPGRRGGRGGRGGRGRGRGFGNNDWEDRRGYRDRNDQNNRAFEEDEFGREQRLGEFNRAPQGGYGGPSSGPGYGGPPGAGYNRPPPPPAPAPAEAADERERLEQAKKVQQLLAALKQPGGGGPPLAAPTVVAPPPAPPAAVPPMPPAPPANAYYNHQPPMPPPPQYAAAPPAAPPASNPYAMPSQPTPPAPTGQPGGAPAIPGLPPNILAMLQQGGQGQPQNGAPPMPPYSMPPASAMIAAQGQPPMPGAPPANPNQPGYQGLMAYLAQKR